MIEALRAGELSSHVGRVLERKEKKRKGRKTHVERRKKERREAVILRENRSDQSVS